MGVFGRQEQVVSNRAGPQQDELSSQPDGERDAMGFVVGQRDRNPGRDGGLRPRGAGGARQA